ncbi:MAG: thioredoxin family protein [Actinobacteria bacterium]|nr:thioredoxin family protein [Actinomycetota bacterium]
MIAFVVAALVVVSGVVVAALVRRRDSGRMAGGTRWSVPAQLERRDFVQPETPRLVVVFASDTCDACSATWDRVTGLADADTAVERVSYQDRPELHERYGIDAVPTLVVADAEGVVLRSFVGPATEDELATALRAAAETG